MLMIWMVYLEGCDGDDDALFGSLVTIMLFRVSVLKENVPLFLLLLI